MSNGLPPTARTIGFGGFVAVCIIGGLLGGLWLDRTFGLSPLFTLVCLLIGVVVAMVGVVRMSQQAMDELDD
jgi:F0F1-type ATP synthase assembly protein I